MEPQLKSTPAYPASPTYPASTHVTLGTPAAQIRKGSTPAYPATTKTWARRVSVSRTPWSKLFYKSFPSPTYPSTNPHEEFRHWRRSLTRFLNKQSPKLSTLATPSSLSSPLPTRQPPLHQRARQRLLLGSAASVPPSFPLAALPLANAEMGRVSLFNQASGGLTLSSS